MILNNLKYYLNQGTVYVVMLILTGITACSKEEQQPRTASTTPAVSVSVKRLPIAAEQLQHGRELFLSHCAQCHGQQAQGAVNWQQPDASGAYPAPPLNGTGHAWHHPQAALVDVIANGTVRLGGKMPAWKDKLSSQEIRTILLWLQSQWPDEIYAAWYRMDREARQQPQR